MMVCFVASAFDRKDVDTIYDNAIRPTLRELKIRCTRVDRVEHNDDIDDKIFALMKAADFCIADLTYARPSVYYEAGYIFGCKKPVIYISRSDHFHGSALDRHGNLRVHFDLQMKNIIPWTEPSKAFAARLKRRISTVVAPLLKAQNARQEELRVEAAFANQSISVQLALLRRFACEAFEAGGFSEKDEASIESAYRPRRLVYVTRNRRNIYQAIHFVPLERLSKSQVAPEWSLSFLAVPHGVQVREVERLFVYATLKNISDAVVRSIFASFTPVTPFLLQRRLEPLPTRIGNRTEPPTLLRIAILPGIRSVPQFKERLKSLLKTVRFD
jgi:nucleoside 2-deoxyribosyltransferase